MKHLAHLAGRFFRSLRSRRPGVDGQRLVADHLAPAEAEVFWRQPVPDQDHALRGVHHVQIAAPDRPDLVRAFLLHDVGKRHSRLGTLRRSIATALSLIRMPMGARARSYLDHAAIGAVELADLGCEPIVVEFARGHHGPCPIGIDPNDWSVLAAADRQ